ncbi:MAG: hypothetical protein A3G26_09995 [Betaproteobacteria bacterium RIFCSPLOWO2_12_FULL_65_110]|nr:MAG: hypothetical protein A3G26_09995 [Betaproteobacteria bacterium RIFCSPLOWO2_12_FULL_65_110]
MSVTLYALTLFTILNHTAYVGSRVAVSLYAIHLHATPLTVGTLMSLYGLLPMLFSVSAGRLSDRVKPRVPLLVGSVLVVVGTLLPFLAPGLAPLHVAATLIGLGFMLFQVTVQNSIGFIGAPERRPANFSLFALGFSVSAFLGPLFAGLAIDWIGYAFTFIFLALLPVATIIALAANKLVLPGPPSHGKRDEKRRVVDLFAHSDVRRVLIITALQATSWELFTFMMPVYGTGIGLSPSVIGVIMGAFAVATFLIRLALPYLARRVTAWRLLNLALLLTGLCYVLFPLVTHVALLMALAFVLGIGLGSAQPMVMALLHDAAPEGRTGEAVGVRQMVITTGQTVMPLLFGALGSALGVRIVFWTVALAVIVGSRAAKKRRLK